MIYCDKIIPTLFRIHCYSTGEEEKEELAAEIGNCTQSLCHTLSHIHMDKHLTLSGVQSVLSSLQGSLASLSPYRTLALLLHCIMASTCNPPMDSTTVLPDNIRSRVLV